jgi:hypothetical protein
MSRIRNTGYNEGCGSIFGVVSQRIHNRYSVVLLDLIRNMHRMQVLELHSNFEMTTSSKKDSFLSSLLYFTCMHGTLQYSLRSLKITYTNTIKDDLEYFLFLSMSFFALLDPDLKLPGNARSGSDPYLMNTDLQPWLIFVSKDNTEKASKSEIKKK